MKKLRHFLLATFALATVALHAQSNKPFSASATTTTGTPLTFTASGSNFTDFVSSIIKTSGSFDQLSNRAFNASATFLGVKDAITFSTNAQATSVTLGLKPINFTQTFTGTSDSDVENQISDFFEKNGADTIARFLKAVAEQSTVAVTDGNPNAATAISAAGTFASQGFTPADEIGNVTAGPTNEEASAGTPSKPKFGGFGIGFNAGRFEAAGFKGETIDVSTTGLSIGFGERVRLLTPLSASYLKVEGAQVGGVGAGLALPIRFRVMSKDNPWNWRVTPTGGVSARASIDLAGGALLWHAGVINSIDYRVNPKVVLCLVNQFTAHKSIKLEYGDFSFDPKVDQQIVKTGVRMVNPLTRRLILDVFVVDTRFLKKAAVDQFYSAGGSLSLRVSQRFNLSLGVNYDTGDNYKSYTGGLSSCWKW